MIIITTDAFKSIYENIMGQTITLNSGSGMTFILNDQKWMTLLKVLSNFKLPEINYHWLNYVPTDSEEVRRFIINSIPVQQQFYFNWTKQEQIKWSKYFEALKTAVRKTTNSYYAHNTDFSAHEFWEIVSAAKLCKKLYFCWDLIPLDFEWDFGKEMEGCKIEYISFGYSGGSSYSNWGQNPARFENLIAAIAKWEPLVKTLKYLHIGCCDITKAKAQEVLNKYKLNGIQISGV